MKNLLKNLIYASLTFLLPMALNAQTNTSGANKQKKAAAPVSNKEISITLKNDAEKDVSVFIGPKTGIKNPKSGLKILGGLSKNTIYLKVSDIICILGAQDKPNACTNIKATITLVEVNASATGISSK